MTGSDIVAMIGAAAWLPQIVQWISQAIRKPKLELISAPRIILGYTASGPFLQLTASISSQNEDVIVTKMNIVVKHQSGEERLLTWSAVTESLASFEVPTEESLPINLPMSKHQSVLAIKAITETLSERHIAFVDWAFAANVQDKVNIAREHFNYLRSEADEPATKILHSKELKQMETFATESVFWREGTSFLEVRIHSKQLKKPHVYLLRVDLTRRDIDQIQAELHMVKQILISEVTGEVQVHHRWNFVTASVIPQDR